MNVRARRIGITTRLLSYLLLAGLVPLVVLGVSEFDMSRRIIIKQAGEFHLQQLKDMRAYLDLYADQIESLAANLAGNEAIGEALRPEKDKEKRRADTFATLTTHAQIGYILNGYVRVKGLVSIDLFSADGKHYHVGDTLDVRDVDDARAREMLAEARTSDTSVSWRGIEDNLNRASPQKKVLIATRVVRYFVPQTGTTEVVGLLVINLDANLVINEFLGAVNAPEHLRLMLLDHQGRFVFNSNAALLGQVAAPGLVELLKPEPYIREVRLDGEDVLLGIVPAMRLKGALVGALPRNVLTAPTIALIYAGLALLLIGMIAVGLLAWRFARHVVAPVRDVSEGFSRLQAHPDTPPAALPLPDSGDEMADLVSGFNRHLDVLAAQQIVAHQLVEAQQAAEAASQVERRRRTSHQRLNEIAALSHLPLMEQFHSALAIGAEHLGLEFGIVSRIDAGTYWVVAQISPPETLHDGQAFPLGDTYCSLTLAHDDVVAIGNMGQSAERGHPGYQAFKLETYIGAPIRVGTQVYGTVNFSSPAPYHRNFEDGDREFLRLLARWAGSVIERDQAQRKVAESELRLKTIIETEPECVKILDPEGRIVQMNRAGLDMIEADAEEQVVGHEILGVIAPPYREAFVALGRRVNRGESGMLEFEIIGLKGGQRWLDTHAVPMRDGDGRITGLLGVTRDITERKQVERVLTEAKAAAEVASLAKSQFLATMSHEIRTPMNGILGMAQLLLMADLKDEERQEYARTILNSGETLLTLLNDILDLSKVEAGKLDLQCAVFAPAQLIQETAVLFHEPVESKGLKLECRWDGPADVRYWGDPLRLRQMLSNLVSNAAKFTAQGSIRIDGAEIQRKDDAAWLEFSVADSGIGIAKDKLDRLFKPFSQVDGSITRQYGGTGLGLSIVANLAKLMGGETGIESEPGKGSRVWFRVWATVTSAEQDARQSERRVQVPAPMPEMASSGSGSGYVLVVEDNLTNRKVIEGLLKKQGMRFESVENGHEAVKLITSGANPSLVLMDCQMPVMDGFAATERIRAWETANGKPRRPIVALTAGAFQEDRDNCFTAGMDDFLAKPLRLPDLQAVLARWLAE